MLHIAKYFDNFFAIYSKKSPRCFRTEGKCQKNKSLQLVSRHSQTVCYIHKRTLQTLAVDVAEVVGLAVVASAELMIKPAARFTEIVLCEISPINVLVHIIERLAHCCLLIYDCIFHIYIFFMPSPEREGFGLFILHKLVD